MSGCRECPCAHTRTRGPLRFRSISATMGQVGSVDRSGVSRLAHAGALVCALVLAAALLWWPAVQAGSWPTDFVVCGVVGLVAATVAADRLLTDLKATAPLGVTEIVGAGLMAAAAWAIGTFAVFCVYAGAAALVS